MSRKITKKQMAMESDSDIEYIEPKIKIEKFKGSDEVDDLFEGLTGRKINKEEGKSEES